MSQYVVTPTRTFAASAALAQNLRVQPSADGLVAASATQLGVGNLDVPALAAGQLVAVRLWSAQGTRKMVANGAIAANADVFAAAGGKVSATAGTLKIGIALEAATADGQTIEVATCPQDMST
jgi:hypothetical protein